MSNHLSGTAPDQNHMTNNADRTLILKPYSALCGFCDVVIGSYNYKACPDLTSVAAEDSPVGNDSCLKAL